MDVRTQGHDLRHHFIEELIFRAMHDGAVGLHRQEVGMKLGDVVRFCGKNIHMVPGNASDHRHMRTVPKKFGTTVHG